MDMEHIKCINDQHAKLVHLVPWSWSQ